MKAAMLLVTTIYLFSCGSSKDSSSSSDAATVDVFSNTSWSTACTDNSIAKDSFSAGVRTRHLSAYMDADCKELAYESDLIGSYIVSGKNIDMTATSSTFIIKDQAFLDQANADKVFGKDDWKLNVSQDVNGLSYDANSHTLLKNGDKFYQIFKIDGSTLLYGDTDLSGQEGLTPATRPSTYGSEIFNKN